MTIEEMAQMKKDGRKTILVGICLDGNGRDILNWALGKVARSGDRVVALHVRQNSEDGCINDNSSSLDLENALTEYLAVYDVFCALKSVDLVGQICRGSSIRKVLVDEAKAYSASSVVLGIGKNVAALGSSVSLAKHCAKKLPPSTTVVAVDNGKVIFQRSAAIKLSGHIAFSRSSLLNHLRPSSAAGCKEADNGVNSLPVEPDLIKINPEKRANKRSKEDQVGKLAAFKDKPTAGIEVVLPTEKNSTCLLDQKNEEVSSSPISILVRKIPDYTPGWPLLRKAFSADVELRNEADSRKMSLVQWVMNLSSRYLPVTILSRDLDNTVDQIERKRDAIEEACDSKYNELTSLLGKNSSSCKWFNYEALESFTDNFSSESLIGRGGCGRVYKGTLPNGQPFAVKVQRSSDTTWRNFLLELEIVTSLDHKHIAPLIGVCVKDSDLFTIFNYFHKGTLDENIHGEYGGYVLPWDKRFRVAVGIAEALNYLHIGCSRPVIHRDVKSSNILLSEEYEAMLSDFGLALWTPQSPDHIAESDILGTFGYLAPEYFMCGKVSDKIDVYSFGVVLLELITGRTPISHDNLNGKRSLVMWAMPMMEKGEWMALLDPNLRAQHDESQVKRMALAAFLCTRRSPNLRPSMSQILELLNNDDLVDWWEWYDDIVEDLDLEDADNYSDHAFNASLYLDMLDEDDISSPRSSLGSDVCKTMDENGHGQGKRSC